MNITKDDYRKSYLKKRRELSQQEWEYLNDQVIERAVSLIDELNPKIIHLFLPILRNREPNTDLLRAILETNDSSLQFVVPKMEATTHQMKHFLLTSTTVLLENKWGIQEPDEATTQEIDPSRIDLVFTPLLAFDVRGYRLGYGGGYYDRFFMTCRQNVQKVGLSFFEPMKTLLPIDKYDIPLDFCITPDNIWSFK
jgi:5-formyltetrahydrofolate cyclo-ligase